MSGMLCSDCGRAIGFRPYIRDPKTKELMPQKLRCPHTRRLAEAVAS